MNILHMGLWLSGALAWAAVFLLLAERAIQHFKAWKHEGHWRLD